MKSMVGDYGSTRCVPGFTGGWKPRVCVVLGLREGLLWMQKKFHIGNLDK